MSCRQLPLNKNIVWPVRSWNTRLVRALDVMHSYSFVDFGAVFVCLLNFLTYFLPYLFTSLLIYFF